MRHAETDWNRQRRYQGHADRPLTPRGERRTRNLAARLAGMGFSRVVTSGLLRTDALGERVAGEPRHLLRDARWREVDHGAWEGLTAEEVRTRFPGALEARYADPWSSRAHGGECAAELWARVEAAWRGLLASCQGERVLVVTHAAPIQLLVCAARGRPLPQHVAIPVPLGGLTRLEVSGETAAVGGTRT